MGLPISKFYQSFSGTDTIAFIIMPGCTPIVIGSLTTISYSMFRNKKPVINIGRTNINGVTRGSRIFAGTMIFTLINQHWLRELQDQWADGTNHSNPYLSNVKELKVDELPLFDIMIVSANEYGSAVAMYIYGIDFTDEAQTISVEDLFTENTFSFIARDISVFKDILKNTTNGHSSQNSYVTIKSNSGVRAFMFDDAYLDWTAISKQSKEYAAVQQEIEQIRQNDYENSFIRELYWTNSIKNPFVGKDVIIVQDALIKRNLYDGDLDGIYSAEVAEAVRKFQTKIGYPPTGIVDRRTYITLKYDFSDSGDRIAIGINKNGTNIYSTPSLSSTISGTLLYGESISYQEIVKVNDNGVERLFIKTERGYIYVNEIYSYFTDSSVIEYPTLKKDADNDPAYVIMLQNALQSLYNNFVTFKYGVYDDETIKFVKKFQEEYGPKYGFKYVDGTVDPDTWIAIEDASGGNFGEIADKYYTINFNRKPGDYTIPYADAIDESKEFYVTFDMDKSNGLKTKVLTKVSAVSYFPGGRTKTTTNTINAVDKTKISLFDLKEALYYDIDASNLPSRVDFFIYPYNSDPFKWTINFTQ